MWSGIVLQAAGATLAVFAVMLALYHTRIIKVTDKFRRAVIFATLGVMVLYLGSFIFSLFGGSLPFLNGDNIVSTLKPATKLQMIAVKDIGEYGALAFTDERFKNLELDIAGDEVTLPQAAEIVGRGLGRPLSYLQIPISEIRKNSEDLALMLEWFEAVGYDADIAGEAKKYGVKPTSLETWAAGLKK